MPAQARTRYREPHEHEAAAEPVQPQLTDHPAPALCRAHFTDEVWEPAILPHNERSQYNALARFAKHPAYDPGRSGACR